MTFSIPVAGATTTQLAIPDSPALVGATFYHQLNVFELDPAGSFVAITASNALQLTVGVF